MTPLEFVNLWRASPFRPFRIFVKGRTFDVAEALQVAMSPNMRLVTLALDSGAVSFSIDDIEGAEPLMAPAPPEPAPTPAAAPAPAVYTPDAGRVGLVDFELPGERLTSVSVHARDPSRSFTTQGTRWDVHGLETFENGRTLYLHHLDDPTRVQRVILWPDTNKGTFDSFSEAMSLGALRRELEERDKAHIAGKTNPEPPANYFESLKPKPVYQHPTGRWWEEGQPDPPDRFRAEATHSEVGRHRFVSAPRLIDSRQNRVLLDLEGTSWSAPMPQGPPPWELMFMYGDEDGRSFTLKVDPAAGTIEYRHRVSPLAWFQTQLLNYWLYEQWDWLLQALAAGPREATEPLLRHFSSAGGCIIELWPGASEVPVPFLQPRLRSRIGRTLLDMRGTAWGASLHPAYDEPAGECLDMLLWHKDPATRSDAARRRLRIDPISRRVTVPGEPGFTSLGVLHGIVQQAVTPEWLLKDLAEAFARGAALLAAPGEGPPGPASRGE